MEIWLNFAAKLLDSLIWPLVVSGFVVWFRQPIAELIKNTKSVKTSWGEVEFDKKLEQVKGELGDVRAEETEETTQRAPSRLLFKDFQNHIIDLLVDSRSLAIQEAWREVEVAAKNALEKLGIDTTELKPSTLHQELTRHGVLDAQQLKIYVQLKELRNKAINTGDQSITDSNALAFADLAFQLVSVLEGKVLSNN